jgi:hypothetical protein
VKEGERGGTENKVKGGVREGERGGKENKVKEG